MKSMTSLAFVFSKPQSENKSENILVLTNAISPKNKLFSRLFGIARNHGENDFGQ